VVARGVAVGFVKPTMRQQVADVADAEPLVRRVENRDVVRPLAAARSC
jgi:hypothetical protein